MNNLSNDNFYLMEEENVSALFVNSTEIPIEYIPLDCYTAEKIDNKYKFQRLYKLTYLLNNTVKYSRYDFLLIKAKPHYEEVLYSHIVLMKGCREFVL